MHRSHSISPALPVVHLGIHVERSEQRIKRRSRSVHQKRFIEPLVLDIAPLSSDVFVTLVNLRCLRKAGSLFVDRLSRKQSRHLRSERLHAHWTVILEKRMERVIANPGFVPEHVVAKVPDLLHDLADVVDGAVVGGELDAGEPEGALGSGSLGHL